MNYGKLSIGTIAALIGSLLSFNFRGYAERAADFLGDNVFSAFHRNDILLRLPAGFAAAAGAALAAINLKVLIFGF